MDSSNQYAMEPLCVTAHLRTPVVADEWLPLDGLLFYQSTRMQLGPQIITTPGASLLTQPKGRPLKGGRLPLGIVHARDWYYRCSWAEWGPHADGQAHWNKRFNNSQAQLIDFRGKRGKVIIGSGKYKAYHMPVFYRAALWVRWYAFGDKGAIEELLSTLTHIGKKVAQGWGRVMRWDVQVWPEDWSVWHNDKLMRGIPIYHFPRGRERRMANYGIRPSYWDRRNQMNLVIPW